MQPWFLIGKRKALVKHRPKVILMQNLIWPGGQKFESVWTTSEKGAKGSQKHFCKDSLQWMSFPGLRSAFLLLTWRHLFPGCDLAKCLVPSAFTKRGEN